jgi:hypothetical protein
VVIHRPRMKVFRQTMQPLFDLILFDMSDRLLSERFLESPQLLCQSIEMTF